MDYFISPNGSDTGLGNNINSPYKTPERLNGLIKAGDKVFLRAGTYTSNRNDEFGIMFKDITGNPVDRVTIQNYNNEKVVFDFNNKQTVKETEYGLYFARCSFVTVKGIRVTGLKQNTNGNVIYGCINDSGKNNEFHLCEVDNMGGQGFFDLNSTNTLYKFCDVHHCDDRYSSYAWNGSNGFSATGYNNTSTGLVYDGCRAWWISDDGFDFYGLDGYVTIKNCWSFWNGYEPGTDTPRGDGSGYKMGATSRAYPTTVKRVLHNNLAFENLQKGIDQNGGLCLFDVQNNTTFGNKQTGYVFSYTENFTGHIFKNNISYKDNGSNQGTETTGSNNTWNNKQATDADFISLSSKGADGPRKADGSLPDLPFLKLSASTKLEGLGAYPNKTGVVTSPTKEIVWKMHIYSDGTGSTAKAVNAKKTLIGDLIYYKDKTTEFIK